MKAYYSLLAFLLIALAPFGELHANCVADAIRGEMAVESSRKFERVSQRIRDAQGTKVMWWNIGFGNIARDKLSANLIRLTHSPIKPDVMVLGEFSEAALSTETREALSAAYAHELFIPYGPGLEQGMLILSKSPLKAQPAQSLKWLPSNFTAEQKADYLERWKTTEDAPFYLRPFAPVSVEIANHAPLTIVPVHLAEPWKHLPAQTTAQELFVGGNNPLIHQVYDLESQVNAMKQPALVIDDFNLPQGAAGIKTRGYRALSKHWHAAIKNNDASFPAPSARGGSRIPPVQIDHGFTTGALRSSAGEVVPLQGSDHLPIYVVIPNGQ